ncbi:hypothetical protein [Kingella potus]|nr:hypothetical protein [Kingella potus]UOP00920.1 hypothetical protein LVJ84_00385 [Kingella potus]
MPPQGDARAPCHPPIRPDAKQKTRAWLHHTPYTHSRGRLKTCKTVFQTA